MPTALTCLHLTWLMCSTQLNLLSIVTPRNVVEDSYLLALSLISSFVCFMCFMGCSKYNKFGLFVGI